MLVLDNRTLLFTQIFIGLCLFFYSLFTRELYTGTTLRLYRFANLSYSLGFSLLLFQSSGNAFFSIIAANTLILAGFMLFTATVLQLLEKRSPLIVFLVIGAVNTVLFLVFTYFIPRTSLRILIIAINLSAAMFYGILLTPGTRDRIGKRYARLFISISGFYIIVSIFRIIFTLRTNNNIQSIFSVDRATSIIFLATIVYHISINSVIFLLVNARSGLELSEKIKLLELSYQDIRNINTFFNDGKQMTDPEQLYGRIYSFLKNRFKIDSLAVLLADRKNSNLVLVYKTGFPEDVDDYDRVMPLDYASTAVMAYKKNSMIMLSMEEYPDNDLKAILQNAGFRTVYSHPIKSLSGNIGVLSMASRTGVPELEKEQEIFTLITNQIGTIIENAAQYQDLKLLADTDPLTGILNKREFFKRLETILQRLKRYDRPACLMILDLDHFKNVNDRWGHDRGDIVLKKTVETTKEILRETDLFGRFGGEEFLILLDETELENARILAERLRKNIENLSMEFDGEELHYTVSIGLTRLNGEDTGETAFSRADKALYRAKNEGRNRTIVL